MICIAILIILASIVFGTGLKGLILVKEDSDEFEKESKVYKVLGNYFTEQGEIEEAIIAYEKSLVYAEDTEVRNNLAILYHEQGKYTKAIEHLRKLTQQNPDNPSSHYDLAVNLVDKFRNTQEQSLQDLLDALAEYQKAEELMPGYANAKENVEVLKKVLKLN